jgi:SAM-dependent methyltransferase
MLQVLQTRQQIDDARRVMASKSISLIETFGGKLARKLGLSRHLPVGDKIKSWDVMATIDHINNHLDRDSCILDIGAYCSELPVALNMLGYKNVHAIDLNTDIRNMPRNDQVKYEVGNFLSTSYEAAKFDAVAAISVIEHGYQPEKLFAEVSRILKPGGCFIASFDYWPQKIHTGGTQFFGMSWLIFSRQDVDAMIKFALAYGLEPIGELTFASLERPIHCLGFEYTFAWMVWRKI